VTGSGARILVVEDTPHNLELMTYLLEAHGHAVVAAITGTEALAHAHARRPDLIILDVQLPDADGYEIVGALRADPALHDVPTIAVTAYATVGDRDHALAAGFDGYLTKPIDPATFSRSVDQHLPAGLRGGTPQRQAVPTQGGH
jgi:CheY-like chemotaxis protein